MVHWYSKEDWERNRALPLPRPIPVGLVARTDTTRIARVAIIGKIILLASVFLQGPSWWTIKLTEGLGIEDSETHEIRLSTEGYRCVLHTQ